jgi:FkbM family methyltransferase
MKVVIRRLLSGVAALPLPQRFLSLLERSFALGQGKGWGAGTIAQEVSACCSLLADQPRLLVDIGGNRGAYAQEFLKRFPGSSVHLFEPSSYNVNILKPLFSSVTGVNIVASALSDKSGKLTLYADKPGSGLGSLSKRRLDHFGIEMTDEEVVPVLRFDEDWEQFSSASPVIDYVKIDVEGHELSVLEGFGDFLKRVKLIQFEFGGCNIDTRTFFQDFWYFFSGNNFSLYRITPRGAIAVTAYREADEFFATTNYIALNNKYKQ